MAAFYDLPDDIVTHILKVLFSEGDRGIEHWMATLYLLAVCQKWRALGKPRVYSTGFIGGNLRNRQNPSHVPSNMMLINNNDLSNMVKTIVVAHNIMHRVHDVLAAIDDAMAQLQTPWSNVVSICLHSQFPINLLNARRLDFAETQRIDKIAQRFRIFFSSVNQFRTVVNCADIAFRHLIFTLIGTYALALKRLSYEGIPFSTDISNALQLHSLSVSFTHFPASYKLKVNPAILKTMALQNLDSNFQWSCFADSNDREMVDFAQLAYLELSSSAAENRRSLEIVADDNMTAWFSSIRRLVLSGIGVDSKMLKCVLVPSLEQINVAWWLMDVRHIDVPEFKYLNRMTLRYELDDEPDFFAKTNALFSRIKCAGTFKLHLHSATESLLWQKAHWPNLTHLELVDFVTTLQFVIRLAGILCDIKYLGIKQLQYPDNEECTDSDSYLQQLCGSTSEPSLAKLEILVLEQRPLFSALHLDASIKTLKWYLPHLAHVIVLK